MLSFGGLLGYLGMNSDGLAVGINLVLGGRWGPGVPPYLAVRHVLDSAGSVDEALGVLEGLRLASSRSLMLCDRRGCAYVEFMDGRMHVVQDTELVHTNHFLRPEFVPFDELNVFAKNSSLRRLDACAVRLKALPRTPHPVTISVCCRHRRSSCRTTVTSAGSARSPWWRCARRSARCSCWAPGRARRPRSSRPRR